jgi:signal peptidase II
MQRKQIIITLSVFLANYFVDRLTKYLAEMFLKGREALRLFHNILIFIYAENGGAFLSMGENWPDFVKYLVLLIIPIIVCVGGLIYLSFIEKRLYRIITGACIIGGGIGNLIDRLFHNFSVIDFMNFGIGNLRTGILNVADLSVTFGVIALFVFEAVNRKKEI